MVVVIIVTVVFLIAVMMTILTRRIVTMTIMTEIRIKRNTTTILTQTMTMIIAMVNKQ